MTLAPGTPLGPYRITGLLGAGGMGEVYRAQDPRLGREVAIKVLPSSFASDADRLRRFEQEARAAGSLNHSNVLIVYDIGTHAGGPYLVTELLEGETLRARLSRGALTPAVALDLCAQCAHGLAAAHAKGIVHRDLKPENLFLTKDGRVKILDFGLAKLVRAGLGEGAEGRTIPAHMSESGQISGTAGYMSPEQVRGEPVDARSDLFALGTILHEMLTGTQTFLRKSQFETLEAIVKDEPENLSPAIFEAHPGLERMLGRNLAKEPERRFQSASDLAFFLEAERGRGPGSRGGATSAAALAGPSFQRLTFRRGYIFSGRFLPDASTIIYAAAWEGKRLELFSAQPGNPESRPLGLVDAELLAISPTGEVAVSLAHRFLGAFLSRGMLARTPLWGGSPREVLEGVMSADWGPGGKELVVVRDVEGKMRLEFPVGHVLHETAGWISHARLSRDGRWIGFIDHPFRGDDAGIVTAVNLDGEHRALSEGWTTCQGLAWSADGSEIWFTAAAQGAARRLHAVTLDGAVRQVLQVPGGITLLDISVKGDVLFSQGSERIGIRCRPPGGERERDLTWLDWTLLRDFSKDGHWILFDETGEATAGEGAAYMRKTDGSPAVRLGPGPALEFSPDRKWALLGQTDRRKVHLVPTGPGKPRTYDLGDVSCHFARWYPDGSAVFFAGNAPDQAMRIFRLDLGDGGVSPISGSGVGTMESFMSPDARYLMATGADNLYALYPIPEGEPRPVPGVESLDRAVRWAEDGMGLLVARRGEIPARVERIDLETGERSLVLEIIPSDPAGILNIGPIRITADGGAYVYSYYLLLHDLYVATNLR